MKISPANRRRRTRLHSFTLVELLIVIAIGSILATFSIMAYVQVVRSLTLTSGSSMLMGALNLARQTAITRNTEVEFRLYQLPDYNASSSAAPTVYRAFQTFLISSNATNALTKVTLLPTPAIISSNTVASSILSGTSVSGATFGQNLPVYQNNYNAIVFDFSPSGGVEFSPVNNQWYMTLVLDNDSTISPTTGIGKNFVTIQLDPFSGRAKVYRP